MMTVRPLAPFGAEITAFPIARPSAALVDDLRAVIVKHRVAVLRDQSVDARQMVQLLDMFGALMFTDGETPVDEAPALNLVSNIGRATPPRSVFHTDTSYVAAPPAFSALRAVLLPDAGGGTVFSDQVRAAAALPDRDRQWLLGRTIFHSLTGADGVMRGVRHPVLRRHPDTGETMLYLSTPERCTGLSGVDAATSKRVIEILYRRSIRPSNLYRHAWRAGDIILWDNRTTMHRADHSDVVGNRVLHRGLVRGEIPQHSMA